MSKASMKAARTRAEIDVCNRIKATSKRDGRVNPNKLGAELAAEFLDKVRAEPELVFAFVAMAGAELVKHFCDMPASKWPVPSGVPSMFGDLPYAMELPPAH